MGREEEEVPLGSALTSTASALGGGLHCSIQNMLLCIRPNGNETTISQAMIILDPPMMDLS